MQFKVCKICNIKKLLSEFYIRVDSGKYRNECKDCISNYKKLLHKSQPWIRIYRAIYNRCNNKKVKNYKNYGGRGIKCLITEEELRVLWCRDKAYLLKKPSIDRKDNDGNYEYSNCQFIEKSLNSKKDKYKSILQYSKNGKFIKEWVSIKEASNILKICCGNISAVLKKRRSYAGRYIWRYASE